jgi:hypothetical protein
MKSQIAATTALGAITLPAHSVDLLLLLTGVIVLVLIAIFAVVVVAAVHSREESKRKAARKVLHIFRQMLRIILNRRRG